MKRFLIYVAAALAVATPAILFRVFEWQAGPLTQALVYGVAILSAGFMLSWGAEAAERHISQGLILAIVALATVLPEYAVDIYFAYRAGQDPASDYVQYAAANMTGANRLLVGVAWPLVVLLHWTKHRRASIKLARVNSIEISFLVLGSTYAFVILSLGRIAVIDFAVLAAIFGAYLYRLGRVPKPEADEDDETGPADALNRLSVPAQWMSMAALTVAACVLILMAAEPFAEAMVQSGRALGLDEFLLIQWLAPLASEAPAVSIAVLFVLAGRAVNGLTAMISDKINQWTLLVGMLPLAMSFGASAVMSLELDARQREEFFLTAAQSVFAISLLLRMSFSLRSAAILFVLFVAQVAIAFFYQDDEALTIRTLTYLGWAYLVLAAIVTLANGRRLVAILRDGLFADPGTLVSAGDSRSDH